MVEQQLRIRRYTAYGLLAVCLVTIVLVWSGVDFVLRPLAVLVFVLTAPGWALISYVNVRHLSVTWVSAVGISLAITLIVAQVLVLTRFWHPEAAVVVLAAVTALPLAHHVLRSRPGEAR
ncbi:MULTISPECIES: hypothetical protein [Amycolatopsis]|uniref:Integral membrane protein n=1 Tax=Amycolatopsis thermalba TaxID=944492 RepID=A0ABY4NWN9_9PSEU|nr:MULTISPECIES: hypothetical protein [Amycolatopsis]OXM67530.1 hypothetical protein CF166_24320 [Amycolatopsis sp. KNN50.9b]UQS24418.1 hypothetical protein L1857_17110 [Amycolatopsis thermalba]